MIGPARRLLVAAIMPWVGTNLGCDASHDPAHDQAEEDPWYRSPGSHRDLDDLYWRAEAQKIPEWELIWVPEAHQFEAEKLLSLQACVKVSLEIASDLAAGPLTKPRPGEPYLVRGLVRPGRTVVYYLFERHLWVQNIASAKGLAPKRAPVIIFLLQKPENVYVTSEVEKAR